MSPLTIAAGVLIALQLLALLKNYTLIDKTIGPIKYTFATWLIQASASLFWLFVLVGLVTTR